MTPSKRREADATLHSAMKEASSGAGVIISLGKDMDATSCRLESIMLRVESLLPGAMQRVLTSYSWLLHATLEVNLNSILLLNTITLYNNYFAAAV